MTGKEFAESIMEELKKMDFPSHPMAVKITSESQVPLTYLSVIEGLRKHYGVSEEALTFFKIHAGEVDEEHSSWNLRVIEEYATNERDQAEARQILRTTAGLVWNLLNVYQRYN
jgi:pyrroloquinoline quinone (PQQ) biosynthesis protein C